YVMPVSRFDVAMLKIHWFVEKRNATSGISATVASLTTVTVPLTALSIVMLPALAPNTAAGFEIGFPEASHTRTFTGIVLPPFRLKTLLPSGLIGARITPPGPPDALHAP